MKSRILALALLFCASPAQATLQTAVIDDNETVLVAEAGGSTGGTWIGTICAKGTFGGGTIAFYQSPDRGTTKTIALTDVVSAAVTATANTCFGPVQFGKSITPMQIYATMSDATTPSVTFYTFDNN